MLRCFGISLCFRTGGGRSVCPGVYYGMALHRDVGYRLGSPPGLPWAEQCWLISSPVPSQPRQVFVPWEEVFLEGWGKCSWRVGAGQEEMELPCSLAMFPSHVPKDVQTMLFCPKSLNGEPEERFPNQKNPVNPQGFGEIEFLLPYLLMEGRGERGRLLDLKISQMALSF